LQKLALFAEVCALCRRFWCAFSLSVSLSLSLSLSLSVSCWVFQGELLPWGSPAPSLKIWGVLISGFCTAALAAFFNHGKSIVEGMKDLLFNAFSRITLGITLFGLGQCVGLENKVLELEQSLHIWQGSSLES